MILTDEIRAKLLEKLPEGVLVTPFISTQYCLFNFKNETSHDPVETEKCIGVDAVNKYITGCLERYREFLLNQKSRNLDAQSEHFDDRDDPIEKDVPILNFEISATDFRVTLVVSESNIDLLRDELHDMIKIAAPSNTSTSDNKERKELIEAVKLLQRLHGSKTPVQPEPSQAISIQPVTGTASESALQFSSLRRSSRLSQAAQFRDGSVKKHKF